MSYYATSDALSAPNFIFVLDTIRRANFRYSLIALQLCNYYTAKRTHSARSRAWKLGLTIDTDKAKKCPQKSVSVVPLPILEVDSPAVALTRLQPVPQSGRWNIIAKDGTVVDIQVPLAPLMACISLPGTSIDMDLDAPDAPQSAFSSDEEDEDGEYSDDDMSISPSPSAASSPSLFIGSSPANYSSGSSLPTPPHSARRATKYLGGIDEPKIMWRITRSPRLSIHSYVDSRIPQRL